MNDIINDTDIGDSDLPVNELDIFNEISQFEQSASSLGIGGDRQIAIAAEAEELLQMKHSVLDFQIKYAKLQISNMTVRAVSLQEKGILSASEVLEIEQEMMGALQEVNSTLDKVKELKKLEEAGLKEQLHLLESPGDSLPSVEYTKQAEDLQKQLKDTNKDIDAALVKVKAVQSDIDKLKQEMNEAQKTLEEAEAPSEIEKAEAEIDKLQAELDKQAAALAENEGRWEKAKNLGEGISTKVDLAVDSLKEWGGFGTLDQFTGTFSSQVGKLLDAVANPLQRYGKSLAKAGDSIFKGTQKYADSLIIDEDIDEFYDNVTKSVKKKSVIEIERMKEEMKTYEKLLDAGASSEELAWAATTFNSPTFRLMTSTMDEFTVLVAGTKTGAGLILAPFKWIHFYLKTNAKLMGSGITASIEGLGYAVGGETGFGIASGVAEGIIGTAVLGVDIMSKVLGPEVQAIYTLMKLTRDAFISHNKYEFEEKAMHEVPFASLFTNFDKLKMKEYGIFSKVQALHTLYDAGIIGSTYTDSIEDHTVLDFWGGYYIKLMNKRGAKLDPYKKWSPFSANRRIPGRYLVKEDADETTVHEPGWNPSDSVEHVQRCIDIENDIADGRLATDKLLNYKDKGQNLLLDVFPAFTGTVNKDGTVDKGTVDARFVRNWVDFPMYANTMSWPPLDGTVVQNKGHLTPDEIDPVIYKVLAYWITTGAWGDVFNTSKDPELRKKAVNLNKLDYQLWMKPDRENDPQAWTKVDLWLSSNKGKRAIMTKNMYKVQFQDWQTKYNKSIRVSPWSQQQFGVDDKGYRDWEIPYGGLFESKVFPEDRHHTISDMAIQAWRNFYNTWPIHAEAIQYYTMVKEGKYWHAQRDWKSFLSVKKQWDVHLKNSTDEQIAWATTLLKSFDDYDDALVNAHYNIKVAFEHFANNTVWDEYIRDTKSSRTTLGYLKRNKAFLFSELQNVTLKMAADKKNEIMQEYIKAVKNAHVPLNTNSYHRALFMGQLYQAFFSSDKKKVKKLQKQLDDATGGFVDSLLITTAANLPSIGGWDDLFRLPGHTKSVDVDLPVYIGNLHCKIVVINKPKPTLMIAFRGTTNAAELMVDLDFTSTEYATLAKAGGSADEYGLHIYHTSDTAASQVKHIMFTDPTAFALHRGFLRAWMAFKPHVTAKVKEIYSNFAIEDVMVTGHSLGAAIAQICCLELPGFRRKQNIFGATTNPPMYQRPHFYGFASPAVGDKRFSNIFTQQVSESIHVYIDGDLVTMVPPFLLPSKDGFGSKIIDVMADIEKLEKMDGSTFANTMSVISFLMGKSGAHLPKEFIPSSYINKNGSFDKNKAFANVHNIWKGYQDHKAVRGGGVFIRLDPAEGGSDEEQSYDIGSSEPMMSLLIEQRGQDGSNYKMLEESHKLSNILSKLSNIVKLHPDTFNIVNGRLPQWEDTSVKKITKKYTPLPRHIIHTPGAKLIGYAKTKTPYAPFSHVHKDDVLYTVPVKEKRGVKRRSEEELKRVVRNHKIYRYENDYHSY